VPNGHNTRNFKLMRLSFTELNK